jgi:RND family efflux transporter MFP subunit
MWFAGAIVTLAVIGGAFYLGYRQNAAKAVVPVVPPQTIPVERGDVTFTVTGPGVSVDDGETTLASQVNARLLEIAAQPGELVTAGQVLAALGPKADFENTVSAARAQVQEAQQVLDGLSPELLISKAQVAQTQAEQDYQTANRRRLNPNSSRGSQAAIEAATAEFHLSKQAFEDAQNAYNNVNGQGADDVPKNMALAELAAARHRKDLATWNLDYLQGKPSANEVAASNAKADEAKAALEKANLDLALAQSGQSPDLLSAQATLQSAQAALTQAQADLEHLEIKAPFDGVVLDVSGQIGRAVSADTPLMTLSNMKDLEAQVTVVEEDLNLIHPGQAVELFFDALPETTVSGKIARIVPKRVEGDKAIYPVYIAIDQIPDDLVPGMTVDATIIIDQRSNVLRLPRTAIRSVGDAQAEVQVWTGMAVEKKTIQVGLHGDSYVEVLSGLGEGDQVVAQ